MPGWHSYSKVSWVMAPPCVLPSVTVTVFGVSWVRVWVLWANSEATNLWEALDSTRRLFWRVCPFRRLRIRGYCDVGLQ